MPDATPPTPDATEERNANPDRLLAFTDAVFAIIVTIMVLDLEVPDLGSGQSLRDSLADLTPTFVAFVISFLLVGMYWAWHRSSFSQVRYVDRNALWLNLLFLLPVSVIPFAAAFIGEYPKEATALHFYGTILIAATVLRFALDFYLYRHPGLLWQGVSRETRRLKALESGVPIVVYAVAMAVAAWVPMLSLLLYFSLPMLYFLMVTFLKTDPRTRLAAEDLG